MFLNILFSITFVLTVLHVTQLLSIVVGRRQLEVPYGLCRMHIALPAAIHQTYFWFSYFGVL